MPPDSSGRPVRVCFVCSGNICRSPTAEVVFTALVAQAGLSAAIIAGSAGTGGWHVGEDMDDRSRRTLRAAGYSVGGHAARQFGVGDFAATDIVVALDASHHDDLRRLARGQDPAPCVVRMREFDPLLRAGEPPDVADPYYGGPDGFRDVLRQIERSCAELLAALRATLSGQHDDRLCL